MACKTSYELHHNFPKLAEESGFTFNTHRPRIRIDWNKIRQIDIDNLVRDRKFTILEQHVTEISDCVLESEFDLRILDEGVVKIFRLAQLAVEYQQFCRHYLDRSVYVLREEITSLAQELERTKKDNREKDEELRKLRKKTRRNVGSLPYGNDNIANMILKTLNNRGEFLTTASSSDVQHYNKCNYCNKVFLNQLYLKGHISRRHGNVTETPEKDIKSTESIHATENTKLNEEVTHLRAKLNEMETIFSKFQEIKQSKESSSEELKKCANDFEVKEQKNVETSAKIESILLEKIEQWKKEEHEKHNKEIALLQAQITETIGSFKEFEKLKSEQNDKSILDQLHSTIKDQGIQIKKLEKELLESSKSGNNEDDKIKDLEAKIIFWNKRADEQSKQYDALLKNLNEVAQEAHESQVLAKTERERAEHLQLLLQEEINKNNNSITHDHQIACEDEDFDRSPKAQVKKNIKQNSKSHRSSLEELHKKAQKLLDMQFSSSESSPSSADNFELPKKPLEATKNTHKTKKGRKKHTLRKNDTQKNIASENGNIRKNTSKKDNKSIKVKKERSKSNSSLNATEKKGNGQIDHIVPASPLKLVRAKLVEEVNNRLVTAGVDPLKRRIPLQIFQKHKAQLQQLQELKYKKSPSHLKIRQLFLAYLDSTVPQSKEADNETEDYTSPNKIEKSFSLGSVISNVKSKALSIVKGSDFHKNLSNGKGSKVAKKALSLLQTPPGSTTSSPKKEKAYTALGSTHLKETMSKTVPPYLNNKNSIIIKPKKKPEFSETDTDTDSTDDDSHRKNQKEPSKSTENLIHSNIPSSADSDCISETHIIKSDDRKQNMSHAHSDNDIFKIDTKKPVQDVDKRKNKNSATLHQDSPLKKSLSDDNIQNSPKHTKGVLKNASSTSSLNKKKVLFDMDAIQMKSISASPSQSLTEKSDTNEKYELGLVNLDDDEWDISSIDNEPLKNDTKIQVNPRTSPKIAELKEKIESQLSRRNETPPTAIIGGFDMLKGPVAKTSSTGGSNTSLGSSILDESEAAPLGEKKPVVKPKHVKEPDDSEFDLSEFSIDGIIRNKGEPVGDSF